MDGRKYCLTQISTEPINAIANISGCLQGPCLTARSLLELPERIDQRRSRIYSAKLTFDGPEYDFPEQCCIKIAYGDQEYRDLDREYDYYSLELQSLGGIAVPRCYGFFGAEIEGVLVGCIVMDLCIGTDVILPDYAEFKRRIMMAICKLHSVGIEHGNLSADYRHYVMDSWSVLIVDFSAARRHNCPGLQSVGGCDELIQAERLFGDNKFGVLSIFPRTWYV